MHIFGAENARIYLLGTDAYGRDQFSRLLFGGQVSLLAGLLGAGITLFIGLCIGAVAGYYGGWGGNLCPPAAPPFFFPPLLVLLLSFPSFLPPAVRPPRA